MNKKYKNLFKDTIIFALGNLGSKVILFFLVPLYTNYLSTDEYGIADLVFTTSQLIVPFVSIVIYEAVVRYGLMQGQNPAQTLKVGVYVGTIGSIITILLTPLLSFYKAISPWKWYLCIYIILNVNANTMMSYLKVKDRNRSYAIISIFRTFIMAILSVILIAFVHTGVKGYLIANIVASLVCFICSLLAGNSIKDLRSATFNTELCIKMIQYSWPLVLNELSWWAIHSSDKIMIEAMVSASALGLYTVASKIPSLINVMISIFGQAWSISSIREIESTNDSNFYSKVLQGYMLITFGSCILFISIIKPFMTIYVGEAFSSSWTYVPLLLVSAVFSSISSYYGQLYGALKKSINSMLTTITGAMINIIVNYYFIQHFGIWGAVIGTMAAYVFLALSRMIDVGRFIDITINYKRFIANCSIIIIQGILVSIGFRIYIVSLFCVCLFIIINRITIKEYLLAFKKRK